MNMEKDRQLQGDALRRRAEERLIKKGKGLPGEKPGDLPADIEMQRLVQELKIHQIELEMQNEELRRARDEAEMEREKYIDIYDFAPVGYCTLDPDGIILRSNLTAARILGIERSRLIGHLFRIHISGDFYATFEEFLKKTFERETTESCEVMFQNRAGEPRFVQLEARLSEDGKKCRLAMIDITDRKRGEAALERTRQLESINQELESFSFSVSHDLRTPLRAIDGYFRMFLKKYGSTINEDAMHMIEVIRSNTARMNVLIEALLTFSKVQKGCPDILEIDMDTLAREVWNEIQAVNREREFEVKITKLQPISGDRDLIRQAFLNLISNAVKFTKNRARGIIEISSYAENGNVVYCIGDNGAGFDMAYYNKLFGLFRRLHSDEEFEGTGIGLALVQRIINRHGGRVWAEGEVGKGAKFYFSLSQK